MKYIKVYQRHEITIVIFLNKGSTKIIQASHNSNNTVDEFKILSVAYIKKALRGQIDRTKISPQ